MLFDIYSYIGKVVYKEEIWLDGTSKKQMYFICGVDKFLNSFICIRFTQLNDEIEDKYIVLKNITDKDIISLSEAYDICYSYIKPMLEIQNLYDNFASFDKEKKKDFCKTLRRFSDTLYMIHYFKDYNCNSFMGDEWNQTRNEMIAKERKKWEKGLRRIKKRTHHYFSDETFDFLVDNYRHKINIVSFYYQLLEDEIKPYINILRSIEKLLL